MLNRAGQGGLVNCEANPMMERQILFDSDGIVALAFLSVPNDSIALNGILSLVLPG